MSFHNVFKIRLTLVSKFSKEACVYITKLELYVYMIQTITIPKKNEPNEPERERGRFMILCTSFIKACKMKNT
jgi:hypothetical protein